MSLVYLLTWPIITCYTTPTCDQQKVVLKESLPISYYMNLYHKSLRQKPQPKPVAHIQQMTTSFVPRPISDIKCGTIAVDHIQPVTNGHDAPEKRYPWQVYVKGLSAICGGVLISSQWVLTAAHCINKTTYILLGTNKIANYSSQTVKSRVIKEIIHEEYNINNDIAMIKLSAEVQFNDYIRPACLPEYGANFLNVEECFLSGWGLTDFDKSISPDLLQEVRVSVISNKDCFVPYFILVSRIITAQHLCTAVNSASGACNGDSGGPLSCLVGPSFYVAGLASVVEAGCQKGVLPDLYTRVSFYRDWIDKTMAEN